MIARLRSVARVLAVGVSVFCTSGVASVPTTAIKDFPGASVTMEVGEGACPDTVPITVRGASEGDFRKGSRLLSRAMAWAQLTIETRCPAATTVQITGVADGATVYKGAAQKADSWVLIEQAPAPIVAAPPVVVAVPPPTPTMPPAMAAAGPNMVAVAPPAGQDLGKSATKAVQRCDALGAHPDDPEAFAKGVSDQKLDAKAVIAACEVAIKAEPQTPRLQFQLARGYLKADRFEDATEHLLIAAEDGHGGALAYLADLHVDGAPGIEADPMLARSLYEKAVASGFQPAAKVLAEYEDKTDAFAAAEQTAPLPVAATTPSLSSRPFAEIYTKRFKHFDIIENVLKGNLDYIQDGEAWTQKYLNTMAISIAGVCDKKSFFSKAQLQRMQAAADAGPFHYSDQGNQKLVAGSGNALFRMLSKPAPDFRKQINSWKLPANMPKDKYETEDQIFQDAMSDAGELMNGTLCSGPTLDSFAKNAFAFVTDSQNNADDAILKSCPYDPRYCGCFATVTMTVTSTRKERKDLISAGDFKMGEISLESRFPDFYKFCRG